MPNDNSPSTRNAADPNIDADKALLRLVKNYQRAELAIAKFNPEVSEIADGTVVRRFDRAVRRQADLARVVLTTPAATATGVLAKIEVGAAWFRPDLVYDDGAPITHHADAALVAIADELAALGYSSGVLARFPDSSRAAARGGDAKLLALAREFRGGAAHRAATEEARDARDALYAPIGRIQARTAEGILAKLMVAAEEISADPYMDGFTGDLTPHFVLASAVADALALAGAGERDAAHLVAIREALGLTAT